MPRRTGHLCQTDGHRLTCWISASVKQDRLDRAVRVGSAVEAELAGDYFQGKTLLSDNGASDF